MKRLAISLRYGNSMLQEINSLTSLTPSSISKTSNTSVSIPTHSSRHQTLTPLSQHPQVHKSKVPPFSAHINLPIILSICPSSRLSLNSRHELSQTTSFLWTLT